MMFNNKNEQTPDIYSATDEAQKHMKREKSQTQKLYTNNLLTFRKRQNYNNRNQTSGFQRLGVIGRDYPRSGKFFAKVKEDEKVINEMMNN